MKKEESFEKLVVFVVSFFVVGKRGFIDVVVVEDGFFCILESLIRKREAKYAIELRILSTSILIINILWIFMLNCDILFFHKKYLQLQEKFEDYLNLKNTLFSFLHPFINSFYKNDDK